jgi:hypothetical protein
MSILEEEFNSNSGSGSDSDTDIQNIDKDFEEDKSLEFEKDPNKEGKPNHKSNLKIYIDSEYDAKQSISLQAYVKGTIHTYEDNTKQTIVEKQVGFKVILVDLIFMPFFIPDLLAKWKDSNNCIVEFVDFSDKNKNVLIEHLFNILERDYGYIIIEKGNNDFEVLLFLYFSAKDLNIAFGPENMRGVYLGKGKKCKIWQRKSITGILTFPDPTGQLEVKIKIKDLFGFEKYGLEHMAESYGIEQGKLDTLDPYKANMSLGIKLLPLEFLSYGLQDAVVLEIIVEKLISSFNDNLTTVFGITDKKQHYTVYNIPFSIGALIDSMFQKYIFAHVFKNDILLVLASLVQGVLNPASPNYPENLVAFSKLKAIKSLAALKELKKNNPDEYYSLLILVKDKTAFKYKINETASCAFLTDLCIQNPFIYALTFTCGGRVVNERPFQVYSRLGGDIDIVSAYGSILKSIGLPLGRPHIYTTSPNESKIMTVGSFFAKFGSNLKNKNYKLIVSGMLSFPQDILISRLLDSVNLNKNLKNFDRDNADTFGIAKPFVLLKKEILNATIIDSIWEVIKKVATSKELKEFLDLKVVAAMYHLDEDQVNSIEELIDIFLSDEGEYPYNPRTSNVSETRTKKWFFLPFEPFIGKLIDKRNEVKKNPLLKALSNSIKLCVNTFYGILSSRFFKLNNTICSDQITGTIRIYCWQLAKSLGTFISVTDGGFAAFEEVNFLKPGTKKPGIASLSSYKDLISHPSIYKANLADRDWKLIFKNLKSFDISSVGKLAEDHIRTFWLNYGINIKFKVECKSLFKSASYMSKAHYFFNMWDEQEKKFVEFWKIRGFRKSKYNEYKFENPMFFLLRDIALKGHQPDFLNLPWQYGNQGYYASFNILKLGSWKLSLQTEGKEKKYSSYGKDVLPGDSFIKTLVFKINNNHFPLFTLDDYTRRSRRGMSYKTVKVANSYNTVKVKAPLFERYLPISIQACLDAMAADKLSKVKASKNETLTFFLATAKNV